MFLNSDKSNPTEHSMPLIYNNFKSNLFSLSSVLFLSLIRCNEIQNVLSDYVIYFNNRTNDVIIRIKIKIFAGSTKRNKQ